VSIPRLMALPLSSFPQSLTSWMPSPMHWPRDARGLQGEGAGRLERENLLGGMAAALGSDWGFWWLLAECGLKARLFPTVIAGLNNQRGGEKLLF
jgi:hypothetical protein